MIDSVGRKLRQVDGYPTRMLLALSLGWAILQTGRFLLPPLLPRIQATTGLTDATVGGTLTALGLVYAAVQFPAGSYSDSVGRAVLVLAGCLVSIVALFGLSVASAVPVFLLSVLLLGLGQGLYSSPSRALLGTMFAERRGWALGVISAGTDVGGLLAAGLAVVALTLFTWQAAFLPVVFGMSLATVLFVLWNQEAYRLERTSLDTHGTLRAILATPAQREVLLAFSLFHVAVGGVMNFFPLLLVSSGRSETLASSIFAVLFVVGLVIKPGAGMVSDRFSRVGVSIAGLLLAAAGISIVVAASSLLVVLAGTVVTAVGYKTQFPIADALIVEAAPDETVGASLGAARSVYLAANALGPGLVGVLAQVWSYAVAFATLAAFLVLASLALVPQYRRRVRAH
ncbi:MFS transporter [Halobacteriales archaeon Cl-PHB]